MPAKSNTQEFILQSKNTHGDRYDYSKVDYKSCHVKVTIVCSIHGEFTQDPMSHINGHGCPSCSGVAKGTIEKFIEQSRKVHGNRYDYSMVHYKNNKELVEIICFVHGTFKQRPESHIKGRGCDACGGSKTITFDEFFKKSNEIHENRYDYSKVNYTVGSNKIIVICPIHGEFEQTAYAHMTGDGCAFCSGKRNTTETFIKKSAAVHGDRYDYSSVAYINAHTPVSIICKTHGIFEQLPGNHFYGHGCPKCRADGLSKRFRMPINDIIMKSREIHGNLYGYSIENQPKNNSEKIKIICKKHGDFFQKINSHLMGVGCPKCNLSKGELAILRYLEKSGINYEYQKRFITCKRVNTLPFDFYLIDLNACVEFDGDQHFVPYYYKQGDRALEILKKTQENDKIKNQWCINNKVPLLRIDTIAGVQENIDAFIQFLKRDIGNYIFDRRKRGTDIPELIKSYCDGASLGKLNILFPYSPSTIRMILKANNLNTRTIKEQKILDHLDHKE